MTGRDDPGVRAWDQALIDLRRWHASRDRIAARAALSFLEPELRLAIPPVVRRTWPEEGIEDALRDFMSRLLERPLPDDIGDSRRYILRSFRNRCIDLHRARQRRKEVVVSEESGWEPVEPGPTAAERIDQEEQAVALRTALASLPVADRVALKLVDAPEWLDDVELAWLSVQSGVQPGPLWAAIQAADDVYELTLLFDPPDQSERDDRRLRMERFRRRRGRARDNLRAKITGSGEDA
jgi:DNA-directed RNA polymerase specialized sigma24 family protein